MAEVELRGLAIDRGIERIVRADELRELTLPDDAAMGPSDGAVRPQLDRILSAPSLDQALLQELRPDIEHKELLIPARYGALLEAAHAAVRAQAARTPRPALKALDSLLDEERELRDILDRYRAVLLKG